MTTPNIEVLIARLRGFVQKLRTTSMPIADIAPTIHEAADALTAQAERIKEMGVENQANMATCQGVISGLTAQLAALDGDDELPEPAFWLTPAGEGFRLRFEPPENDTPMGWDTLYTADQLRQAQAMVRAKMVPLEKDAAKWRHLRDGDDKMLDHTLVLARLYGDELRCEVSDYDKAMEIAMGITGEPK